MVDRGRMLPLEFMRQDLCKDSVGSINRAGIHVDSLHGWWSLHSWASLLRGWVRLLPVPVWTSRGCVADMWPALKQLGNLEWKAWEGLWGGMGRKDDWKAVADVLISTHVHSKKEENGQHMGQHTCTCVTLLYRPIYIHIHVYCTCVSITHKYHFCVTSSSQKMVWLEDPEERKRVLMDLHVMSIHCCPHIVRYYGSVIWNVRKLWHHLVSMCSPCPCSLFSVLVLHVCVHSTGLFANYGA